jgi:hypothetical protein
MPVKTLADQRLQFDALILAQEDPERPHHCAVIEVLRGDPGDVPIDAFLPSVESGVRIELLQNAQKKPSLG